ncbi:hypothetical protein CLOM_g9400 [Closterium sp. NIES-68]|nr:hypothetical protein CLOM_g9400 [Closterium sp. NIES-68]
MAASVQFSLARPAAARLDSTAAASESSAVALRTSLAPSAQRSLACRRSEVAGRSLALAGASAAAVPASLSYRRLGVFAAKRVQSDRSLVLSSTLEVTPGKEKEAQELCKKICVWAEEKKKDRANGIIHFECTGDAYESNLIHFWERFDSFLSMNNIHASPDYTKFLEEVRPLLEAPVKLAAYEYKDGQIGHMLNPIGPKGEGGLDDATGQGGSGGGASYKQTSQSVSQGIGERDGWGMANAIKISGQRKEASDEKEAVRAENALEAIAKSLKSLFGQK